MNWTYQSLLLLQRFYIFGTLNQYFPQYYAPKAPHASDYNVNRISPRVLLLSTCKLTALNNETSFCFSTVMRCPQEHEVNVKSMLYAFDMYNSINNCYKNNLQHTYVYLIVKWKFWNIRLHELLVNLEHMLHANQNNFTTPNIHDTNQGYFVPLLLHMHCSQFWTSTFICANAYSFFTCKVFFFCSWTKINDKKSQRQ